MEPSEFQFYPPNLPPYYAHQLSMVQDQTPGLQFQRMPIPSRPDHYSQANPPRHVGDLTTAQYSPSLSNNSNSDEAESLLINERKQRRMISNRESARRSRMRKQRHLDELWSQVVWLRNENSQLVDKLNRASEVSEKVAKENAQLKEETSELRQMIADMKDCTW